MTLLNVCGVKIGRLGRDIPFKDIEWSAEAVKAESKKSTGDP